MPGQMKVNLEFVKSQQTDAISNIKGQIASSDLGSISERGVHKLDGSDSINLIKVLKVLLLPLVQILYLREECMNFTRLLI
jgi:hypothetical protein